MGSPAGLSGDGLKHRSPGERLALIVLAAIACWCGSAPGSWAAPPPAVQKLTEGSLRLVGRFGAGHACPIEPRVALTNGHMVDPRPFDVSVALVPLAWSDGTGASGFLAPLRGPEGRVLEGAVERARDLARVEPLAAGDVFPHPLRLAQLAPVAGDRVWLLGFDWGSSKSAMADDVIEARVTRVVALHVMFRPAGKPGSSGSCVVNEAGEVVAINEGGFETGAAMPLAMLLRLYAGVARPATSDDVAGLAVGVWGSLSAMPKE